MKPIKTASEIAEMIQDGASIMVGGFITCGRPWNVLEKVFEKGVKKLTIIANDTEIKDDTGIVKLIKHNRVSKFVGSYVGLNPILGQKMNSGEIEVELVPQGTLAERIRARGAGLGGFLTPTGLGTEVETGREKFTVDGKDYLLEKPLGADFAIIKANICDRYGNCFIAKSAKNFNLPMAMAADFVVAETQKLVEVGELDPELVTVPGVFIDAIVEVSKNGVDRAVI